MLAAVLLDAEGQGAFVGRLEEDSVLMVPHLCDVEVLSALRKAVRLGHATEDRAEKTLALYLELPLRRVPHTHLLGRAFQLRANFTAYDAVYVALAEGLHASLVTADARLARAARDWTALDVIEV